MHIVVKILLGVIVLVVALVGFGPETKIVSLKNNRPATQKKDFEKPHTYYYYPKANFYYDSTDEKYICWDSANATWTNADKLPVEQVDIGKSVRIGQSTTPVWMENPNHRLIYSVSLYSAPADFKKPVQPVYTDKVKPIAVDSLEEKKSGVKKFFNRIFSPKKKKES